MTPPFRTTRIWVALLVAVASGLFAGLMASRPGATPDLLYPLTAARFFLAGESPYQAMPGEVGAQPPFDEPFFYPLTKVVALTPLAALPTAVAVGLFFALSSGLLAFVITRDALWRLHIFASAPFVVAASVGQFSPLLTVAALVPWAGALCTIKPNLGLAVLISRPSRAMFISCAAFGLFSLLFNPRWPLEWLSNLRQEAGAGRVHEIPVMQVMGGWLLVLALLTVRRANGRLLAVMSVLPQALFFYDQLPLLLTAETRQQSVLLTASSQAAMLAWWLLAETGDSIVRSAYPFVVALIYLPVLAVVLRNARRGPSDEPGARLLE